MWPATIADMENLAPRLREEDRREIENAGLTPLEYLLGSLKLSARCLVVEIDSVPACVCGVIPELYSRASVWLSSTPAIECLAFYRRCRNILAQLIDGYDLVHSIASVANDHHFRWADWMGFKRFTDPLVLSGRAYHHFYKTNTCPQQPSR